MSSPGMNSTCRSISSMWHGTSKGAVSLWSFPSACHALAGLLGSKCMSVMSVLASQLLWRRNMSTPQTKSLTRNHWPPHVCTASAGTAGSELPRDFWEQWWCKAKAQDQPSSLCLQCSPLAPARFALRHHCSHRSPSFPHLPRGHLDLAATAL